ncbi:unnamed protein product [Triticum turgidum subsp. durum]|uniref:Uncharacterized protein n=1 Tax=Triticum turgidum subsp. durum TaxID=4567 RepID=A0A9R0UTG8_TRITD|nr:unnamed protein product [Triticum turgidum subsp. durum]
MSSEIALSTIRSGGTDLGANRVPGALNLNLDLEAGKQVVAKDKTRSGNVPKVREQLRSADEDSYTPHNVPIGPYHGKCPSTPWVQKEKQRYVGFMQNLSEKHNDGGLKGLVEELEPRARDWYGDGVDRMTSEELARMLLHDGCYLLGWLGNYPGVPQTSCNDYNAVFRDTLYLIENQVPFFVLDKIHARATGGSSSLLHYMATYIKSLLSREGHISTEKKRLSEPPSHLLHLVHTFFRPTNGQMVDPPERPYQLLHRVHAYLSPTSCLQPNGEREREGDTGRWRRATEYCTQANVQFRRRDFAADVTSILDVRLKGGKLDIPCLQVDGKTWTLLRNMMALEEHAEMTQRPVTAYCLFMSQVACTVEDVRLLVDAKIIQHFESSDKIAAQGFANLCKGVVMDVDNIDRNYLKPMWHDLEKLCDSKARNLRGSFRHKYCSTTLHQVAFGITAFLAICQLLQSIYAPIAYHFPKH